MSDTETLTRAELETLRDRARASAATHNNYGCVAHLYLLLADTADKLITEMMPPKRRTRRAPAVAESTDKGESDGRL